ncbi:MAG: hypothetical protein JW959_07265 [Pirellulales bacterium]|nr:hypothetical protein [Pirellulales bacterium]
MAKPMFSNVLPPLPVFQRRRARRLAVWNGAVWAIGNGLAGATLIIYLARELHYERLGLGIGLILAAPHVAGLLRLAAPAMIQQFGNRKRFCIACFLLSALTLSVLPWTCAPGRLPAPGWSLTALIALWCVYHLLQYLGTVALWSWLADVARGRIRGRFLGVRERWMVAGTAAAAIDVGLFVWGIEKTCPALPAWIPYGIATALGAGFMFVALVPLCLMPSIAPKRDTKCPKITLSDIRRGLKEFVAPFGDARFLPLLLFGCWFSLFNGVTQAAQRYFPMHVLGLPLAAMLSLETGSRLGRWGVSPRLGALADRFGNRPVMIVSQLLVAAGMLFFVAATLGGWWWLVGAWALWIAYAGLNVCMPNLMLKLAPRETNASYIAAFDGLRGLFYAVSVVVGGRLVDLYRASSVSIGPAEVQFFALLFLFGWATRSLGAAILLLVKEQVGEDVGPGRDPTFD